MESLCIDFSFQSILYLFFANIPMWLFPLTGNLKSDSTMKEIKSERLITNVFSLIPFKKSEWKKRVLGF